MGDFNDKSYFSRRNLSSNSYFARQLKKGICVPSGGPLFEHAYAINNSACRSTGAGNAEHYRNNNSWSKQSCSFCLHSTEKHKSLDAMRTEKLHLHHCSCDCQGSGFVSHGNIMTNLLSFSEAFSKIKCATKHKWGQFCVPISFKIYFELLYSQESKLVRDWIILKVSFETETCEMVVRDFFTRIQILGELSG